MRWITSLRGFQFTWGPASILKTQNSSQLIKRIMILNIPLTISMAFISLVRDSPQQTPLSTYLHLGFPSFLGLNFLLNLIYTLSFGIWLSTWMDIRFSFLTLIMIYVYKVLDFFKFSNPILDLFNPIYYQPIFNSPHTQTNLYQFWGQGWQRLFQRTFLVGGGKPLIWFTNRLGIPLKYQRLIGLFGIFSISALSHEYS